jgi:hypothetical protein
MSDKILCPKCKLILNPDGFTAPELFCWCGREGFIDQLHQAKSWQGVAQAVGTTAESLRIQRDSLCADLAATQKMLTTAHQEVARLTNAQFMLNSAKIEIKRLKKVSRAHILAVLEANSGRCMDDEDDRKKFTEALLKEFKP